MTPRSARSHGFTLIEVMIALAIFSIVAAISYATFSQAALASRKLSDEMQALQVLQRSLQTIANDFSQIQSRPVREPTGVSERAPLLADARNLYVAELTRTGYANPLGLQRAGAQRVGYRFDEGELIRAQWPALDNPLSNEPVEIVLIDQLESVEFRYLGPGEDNWSAEWPIGNVRGSRPRAVEVLLQHDRWGEVRRLVEVR